MVKTRFVIATAPATEPISSAELVSQCRINSTEATTEATYITTLIKGARMRAESLVGPIITQAWDAYLDDWPSDDIIEVCKPRITAITSVKYTVEDASVATTLAATTYTTDFVSYYARIRLRSDEEWPTDDLELLNPIAIRFSAGWANADAVPQALKQAILFLAGHWYDNRAMIVDKQLADVPGTFIDLITDYRDWGSR